MSFPPYEVKSGDGAQTIFTFSFPYLNTDHVKFYISDVETTFTWVTTQSVEVSPAPVVGTNTILIKRATPTDTIIDFTNGSTLGETDLDTSALQAIYIAEEAAYAAQTLAMNQDGSGVWDSQSKRIKDVADPVNDQDAATKASIITLSATQVAACEAQVVLAQNEVALATAQVTLAQNEVALATAQADAAAASAINVSTAEDNTAADALSTAADVIAAAASVVTAANLASNLHGTSTTSLLIGTGEKVFITEADKSFDIGAWLSCSSDADPTNFMHGQVTAYTTTNLTLNITNIGGSGTFADWTIQVSGTQGSVGTDGPAGVDGGLATETVIDNGTGATLNLDGATQAAIKHIMNAPTTITSSNLTVGTLSSFVIRLSQDGVGSHAVTLPVGTTWPYGDAPLFPTLANSMCKFVLETWDAGSTWEASWIGAEYA